MIDFLAEASAIEADLIALRREIHRHPELGRQEKLTTQLVERELNTIGISTRRVADTGVEGTLTGALPGPMVALRADMDALPVQEQTGLSCASETPGVMHACGHDLHTAALLGAARLLSAHRDRLCGCVRFLFQPDEEGDGGAARMISDGCMDGVCAVFGAHVAPEYPCGTVGVRFGKAYAASNPFDITLRGRSSHGAEPHLGADVIVAAGALIGAIQTLVSREVSPLDSAVISVGSMHAGTARNIIADEARLSGIIRCFGPEMRNLLADRLTAMTNAVASAHDCDAEIKIQWGYSGIINHDAMTAHVQNSAYALLGSEHVIVEPSPSLTTEDFGEFLSCAPGTFWHIGVGRSGVENAPLHNPRFNPDEGAIRIAAALHAKSAWDYLNQA